MIHYHGFTKDFARHRAVDTLTLDVPRGAVVALLGPNGSGKTTTIKAAAGLVRPTAGNVWLGETRLAAADPDAPPVARDTPGAALPRQSARAEELGRADQPGSRASLGLASLVLAPGGDFPLPGRSSTLEPSAQPALLGTVLLAARPAAVRECRDH